MRVLMLSKACIVGIYQRKLEYIAAQGVDLLVAVPPSWKDERGEVRLERAYINGYTLHETLIRFNGNFHLHYYPAFPDLIRVFDPHIVHIDEEPYNAATWHALFHARGRKTLFFTWQNINRTYPLPFRWGEQWVMNTVDYALAGTESAVQVYREKGYTGEMAVVPQFGVDAALFQPMRKRPDRPFTVGFVGRLVPEKGVDLLLQAVAALDFEVQVRIVGGGPQRDDLMRLAQKLGIANCVEFVAQIPSAQMPAQYHSMDVLVLPSLTRPNWKEQFGRVMLEAMASGVPVIGSNSGAIPDIIGDAGMVVPEGDVSRLADALRQLHDDSALYAHLKMLGRERVTSQFTHEHIASQTVQAYHTIERL